MKIFRNLAVFIGAIAIFGLIGLVFSQKTQAATITATYINPPYSYCGDPHTYYDIYAPGAFVTVPQGTSSVNVTFYGKIHVCSGVNYDWALAPQFNFRSINSRLTGMSSTWFFGEPTPYGLGAQRGYIYTQSRNVTVDTAGLGAGTHNLCFEWQGSGYHGFWDYTAGWYQNCVTVTVSASPPPQNGKITVTKYGPDHTKVESCINFIFASLACTGNASSTTKDDLNTGASYNVTNVPDSGWKISKIHINQYNASATRILNEDRAGPGLNPVPLVSGGTTFVDVYYERAKGTLQIVKYPEKGATDANLTAHGKNSSNSILFSVGPSEHTDSRQVNTDNSYKAQFLPSQGFKVTRVRVNRQTPTGITTICDNCSLSGDTLSNISVLEDRTTWVDVFYEPNIRGSLDDACPRGSNMNGKAWGWVIDYYYDQQSNNPAVTPSQVRVRITEKDNNGSLISSTEKSYTVTANKDRPDLPANTSNPQVGRYHGFEFDIPLEYFNGKNYDIKVFPLRNNGGIGNPPYLLGQRNMNCPPPTGRVTCLKEGDQNFIQGWAFDPRKPEGPSHAHIYYDSTPGNTSDPDAIYNRSDVYGTEPLSDPEIEARRADGYIVGPPRGIISGSNGDYRFKVPIPDGLHDGENHTVRVYMITVSSSNPGLEFVNAGSTELTFGPSNPNCGTVEKWYWPWLQTQNGDVVAKGQITGQKIAQNNQEFPGARLRGDQSSSNTIQKEAEYLVISMLGGGNPFCSTYNYILTNTTALTGDCKNGSGYGTLSLFDVGKGSDDVIYKEIVEGFNANGAGVAPNNTKCAPFNTQAALQLPLNTGQGTDACENGTIFRFQGSNLSSFELFSGRNTIFKDGNLVISGNITVPVTGVPLSANPRLHPNLAIIVNGDVYIDRTVTQIDAAIYATGKIYTCSNSSPIAFENCNSQLTINGMLASKKGYDFRRTFANDNRQPAELIRLKGQNIAFPPPGLSSLYFEDANSGVQIDAGELQPRF